MGGWNHRCNAHAREWVQAADGRRGCAGNESAVLFPNGPADQQRPYGADERLRLCLRSQTTSSPDPSTGWQTLTCGTRPPGR